jgi:ribosomal protein S18 acetylase RimI-like enzyme
MSDMRRELLKFYEIGDRTNTADVMRAFLALDYPPDMADTKVDQAIALYDTHPRARLFGIEMNDELIGIVGVIGVGEEDLEIRHIAVLETFRGQGVGSEMISAVQSRFSPESLTAETDRGAVGFYRRLGFRVESLGEKYPGVERFLCTIGKER